MTLSLTIRGHLLANKSSECHGSMGKRKTNIMNQWVDQKKKLGRIDTLFLTMRGYLSANRSSEYHELRKKTKEKFTRKNEYIIFDNERPFVGAWIVANEHGSLCCSVLRCVAACCGVLQCDEACCRVLQRVAFASEHWSLWLDSLLQCVAACCTDPYDLTVCWSVLQCDAVCCSVLQCVALCCSVLQRVALIPMTW